MQHLQFWHRFLTSLPMSVILSGYVLEKMTLVAYELGPMKLKL